MSRHQGPTLMIASFVHFYIFHLPAVVVRGLDCLRFVRSKLWHPNEAVKQKM